MRDGQTGIILFVLLLIVVFLSVGIVYLRHSSKAPSNINVILDNGLDIDDFECNSPYIQVGRECCLDKDYNKICDRDEIENLADQVVDDKHLMAPTLNAPPQQAPEIREFDPGRDHIRGDPDAPVKMIEYSDFECPFCAKLTLQTLPALELDIESGKVALVFRHFPLSFHPNAQKAAEASECAAEQDKDKFWEMHDLIFENQESLSVGNLKKWAEDISLNEAQFSSCLDSGKMAQRVQEDFRDGQKAGVRGTPATFVNGQLISGAQPPQAFQQAIQQQILTQRFKKD